MIVVPEREAAAKIKGYDHVIALVGPVPETAVDPPAESGVRVSGILMPDHGNPGGGADALLIE